MSWQEAWREGRTGWDAGRAAPALVDWIERSRGRTGRALVPGCGAGYDVAALARAGWKTTGLDLAEGAAERFAQVRAEAQLGPERARVELADFFAWSPGERFDMAWDYTFLCAIEPTMRVAWAEKMAALIRPGGTLLTLLFPVDDADARESTAADPGPPYRLHPELARRLLGDRFVERSIERPARSHPGRAGKEWLGVWERRS